MKHRFTAAELMAAGQLIVLSPTLPAHADADGSRTRLTSLISRSMRPWGRAATAFAPGKKPGSWRVSRRCRRVEIPAPRRFQEAAGNAVVVPARHAHSRTRILRTIGTRSLLRLAAIFTPHVLQYALQGKKPVGLHGRHARIGGDFATMSRCAQPKRFRGWTQERTS